MTQSYEPKRTEVLDEMLKPVSDAFDRFPNFKKGVKNYATFVTIAGAAIGVLSSFPLAIPTWARLALSPETNEWPRIYSNDSSSFVDKVKKDSFVVYGLAALPIGIVEASAIPNYLAISLATNALSGLYELGRSAYRKTRERLVKEHKGLESIASSE